MLVVDDLLAECIPQLSHESNGVGAGVVKANIVDKLKLETPEIHAVACLPVVDEVEDDVERLGAGCIAHDDDWQIERPVVILPAGRDAMRALVIVSAHPACAE